MERSDNIVAPHPGLQAIRPTRPPLILPPRPARIDIRQPLPFQPLQSAQLPAAHEYQSLTRRQERQAWIIRVLVVRLERSGRSKARSHGRHLPAPTPLRLTSTHLDSGLHGDRRAGASQRPTVHPSECIPTFRSQPGERSATTQHTPCDERAEREVKDKKAPSR